MKIQYVYCFNWFSSAVATVVTDQTMHLQLEKWKTVLMNDSGQNKMVQFIVNWAHFVAGTEI